MHNWLGKNSYLVNEKFKQFVTVLQHNNITNACCKNDKYSKDRDVCGKKCQYAQSVNER